MGFRGVGNSTVMRVTWSLIGSQSKWITFRPVVVLIGQKGGRQCCAKAGNSLRAEDLFTQSFCCSFLPLVCDARERVRWSNRTNCNCNAYATGGQASQYYAAKKGGIRNVANDERGVSCQIFVSDALNNSLASGYRKYNYISIQSVHAPVRRQQRDTAASERPLCFDVIRTSADSFLYISFVCQESGLCCPRGN